MTSHIQQQQQQQQQQHHHTVNDHYWHYILLELTADPNSTQFKPILDTIDMITWKGKILTALNRSYGLLGESLHFDILMQASTKAVIRIDRVDTERFINALLGYVFKINLSYGDIQNKEEKVVTNDVHCYFRVVCHGDYLGMVVQDNFQS